jgi:hypothetical protein
LYWYNSCDAKEELAENCGVDTTTSNVQCNGSWIQQETLRKGCANDACTSESVWTNFTDCAVSGKKCQAGVCVTQSSGGGGGGGGGGGIIKPPVVIQPVIKMTRAEIMAKINEIVALIANLQAQLKAMTGATTFSCSQITKNLFYGMKNDAQVKCLQEVLKAQGFAVAVSGNYDLGTKTAVAQFQQKYAKEILAPFGLKYGSGNVGNATKNKINYIIFMFCYHHGYKVTFLMKKNNNINEIIIKLILFLEIIH